MWGQIHMFLCVLQCDLKHTDFLFLSFFFVTLCTWGWKSVIDARTDAGTDCRESPTTCSVSGFRCLGKPPRIHALPWLAQQPTALMRELARFKLRMPVAPGCGLQFPDDLLGLSVTEENGFRGFVSAAKNQKKRERKKKREESGAGIVCSTQECSRDRCVRRSSSLIASTSEPEYVTE